MMKKYQFWLFMGAAVIAPHAPINAAIGVTIACAIMSLVSAAT